MVNIEDIQKNVKGNSDWVKFGGKDGDPFLSLFSDQIKQELSAPSPYIPGKVYKFVDGEFEYKILVTDNEGKNHFDFYIKPKQVIIQPSKKKINLYGFSPEVLFIGGAVIITVLSLIMLLPFLFW